MFWPSGPTKVNDAPVADLSDPTDHRDPPAEASRGDRLGRALAARVAAEPLAENRLAGLRQVWHGHDEVHVEAAQHKNPGQRFDRWQDLRLPIGLAVCRWGHRAPHGTGDHDDGQ